MATSKSDFAQKLLSDLRARKENLAATQNSNRQPQPGQMSSSREKHGKQALRPYRSAQQTSTQTAVYRTGNSNRTSNRATSFSEPSNQLVLYETGQNSGQVTDLSTAIAFAFESTGKLQSSGSNPLVNFFKRFGRRRSMDSHKTNIITFDKNIQSPSVSHAQITEISKGVDKINQILRVCSNGINFDRNSFEVGKELLNGSIDLEESLRLLVNLQEASVYNKSTQQKNRIRFLDEDEDDEEETGKIVENWQVSRPRFSFDNTSRNSYIVQGQTTSSSKKQENVSNVKTASHKRSISYDQDYTVKQNHNSRSSQEKGRVSNVIAKLMGLEDVTQKEEKEMKVPRRTNKLAEPLNRERRNGSIVDKILCQRNADAKLHPRPEKNQETLNEHSGLVLERSKPRKDSKVQSVGTDAVLEKYHASVHYQGNEHRIFQNHERELNLKEKREKKMPQNGKPPRAEDIEQNRSDRNLSVGKRNTKKDLASNQQVSLQVHKKRYTEQKAQHLEKKRFPKQKREGDQVESSMSTKSENTSAANVQKKILRDISVPSNGKPKNLTIPKRESPNSSNMGVALMGDTTKVATVNEEDLKKEDKSQNVSPRKPEIGEKKEVKLIPASVTQKKAITHKVDKSENISKIDVLMTRKNASMNQLPRSVKQTTNMLLDLERHIRNKNHSSKRKDQPSDTKDRDGKAAIIMSNASEKNIETGNQPENLQSEPGLVIKVESPAEDECKSHNTPTANQNKDGPAEDECNSQSTPVSPNQNEKYTDQKEPGEVFDCPLKAESGMSIEEPELGQYDQSNEEKHVEEVELDRPAKGREQEHLTEPEKELKELVLKSQMFLNAAEALFKLNIPVSFLQTTDYNCVSPPKKLLLDCGYDIMKRKARRHEMTLAMSRTPVSSLDELVKQLCMDIEVLKSYGGNGDDVAESLHEMLNTDIYDKFPDANNMWDYEWNKTKMVSVLPEKEHVVRDVEKYMLNGLLDEITNDLLLVNVSD